MIITTFAARARVPSRYYSYFMKRAKDDIKGVLWQNVRCNWPEVLAANVGVDSTVSEIALN